MNAKSGTAHSAAVVRPAVAMESETKDVERTAAVKAAIIDKAALSIARPVFSGGITRREKREVRGKSRNFIF